MLSEVSIGGVYIPPLLFYLIITLPVFSAVRMALTRAGVSRFAWHPALLECAVFCALLSTLVLQF